MFTVKVSPISVYVCEYIFCVIMVTNFFAVYAMDHSIVITEAYSLPINRTSSSLTL